MLPLQTRRKADFVVSILFIFFGAFIIYEASQMPWARGRFAWYASPGLFPTIIGILLILFSLRVLLTAIKDGGHRSLFSTFGKWVAGLPRNRRVLRVVFIALWLAAYIFLGLGNYNYQALSAVFLAVFIGVFWLPGSGSRWPKRLAITIVVAIAVPIVISYIFSTYLFVPAP